MTKDELKELTDLERSAGYRKVLRPYLISFIHNSEVNLAEPQDMFGAVKNEITRLTKVKTIRKIVDFIERAENSLDKKFVSGDKK